MSCETFTYFAYASNLLAKRIRINNPSAVRIGIGKLNNYQLTFNKYSNRWKGCSATIIPHNGRNVWGAIWQLDLKHMSVLDAQEGVLQNIYMPLTVPVELPNDSFRDCRVFQQCNVPNTNENIHQLALDRLPSKVYLDIILDGAKESGLPKYYQQFLKTIPHNGYDGEIDINLDLCK